MCKKSTLQYLTNEMKGNIRMFLLKVPWMRGNTVTHDVGSVLKLSCFLRKLCIILSELKVLSAVLIQAPCFQRIRLSE